MSPDKHFNQQRGVNATWASAPQTLHHLHKMFLVIRATFPSLRWQSQWIQCDCDLEMNFPQTRHFKLSLSDLQGLSSLVSTCSDSEPPSLRLLTFRRLWDTFVHQAVCFYTEREQMRIPNLPASQHHVTGANLATTCILMQKSNKTTAHDHLI